MEHPDRPKTHASWLLVGGALLILAISAMLVATFSNYGVLAVLEDNQVQIDGFPGATVTLEGPTTIEKGKTADYVVRVSVTPEDGESNATFTTTLKAVLTGSGSLTVVPLAADPEQTASITNGNRWHYTAASDETGVATGR